MPTPASNPGRFRYIIGILLLIATTINYMDRQILALLKPTLDQLLGWTNEQYGEVNSAFQATYAVSYVFFGWLLDRVGIRLGYAISALTWSLAAIGHAFVGSVRGFFFARLALGAGEGGSFPAGVKAVAHWFPVRERAFAASLFINVAPNLAPIIAPIAVPLIAATFGWQATFIAAGIAGFAWVVLWWPLYRNEPAESRFVSPAERAWIESDQDAAASTGSIGWLRLFAQRETWGIIIAKILTDPVSWFFLIWLPDFFKKTRGMDLKNSWVHLVSIYAFAVAFSVLGGWLSGRLIRRGWTPTRARKTTMFLLALCVAPVGLAPHAPVWIAVLLIGLAAGAHQAWSATIYASTADIFPKRSVGAINGIIGGAGSVGGIIFPIFAGRLLDHYQHTAGGETKGYAILFAMCGSAYVVAFAINHLFAPRFELIRTSP